MTQWWGALLMRQCSCNLIIKSISPWHRIIFSLINNYDQKVCKSGNILWISLVTSIIKTRVKGFSHIDNYSIIIHSIDSREARCEAPSVVSYWSSRRRAESRSDVAPNAWRRAQGDANLGQGLFICMYIYIFIWMRARHLTMALM